MKRYTFRVIGVDNFPVDMLRYDGCYPRTSEAVLNIISENEGKPRSVELVKAVENKEQLPTTARWASFGWKVTDINYLK